MRQTVSPIRALPLALLASVAVLAAGGCSWFHKGPRGDYALPTEQRPLEVPPDLNLPDTAGAMKIPTGPRQAATPEANLAAAAKSGFLVAGERDEVFAQVSQALADVPGLTISSSAQMLGSFDVSYEGHNFLVRVAKADAGSYVSAVDPRGMPATDESAVKLIAALKEKLAG